MYVCIKKCKYVWKNVCMCEKIDVCLYVYI